MRLHWRLPVVLGAAFSLSAAAVNCTFSTGVSLNESPRSAGEEAARAAKAGLHGQSPVGVIVFAARAQLVPELIAGIATQFNPRLVYGCEGYAPLNRDTNIPHGGHAVERGVVVLAFSGDLSMHVETCSTQTAGGYENAGRILGTELVGKLTPDLDAGRVVLTFGDQHAGPANEGLVRGFRHALPAYVPVAGAAAGGPEAKEIVSGRIVTGVNVAVLLQGPFHVRTATGGGRQDLVRSAADAFSQVFAGDVRKALVAFVFDCGGRRGSLVAANQLGAEHAAMVRRSPPDCPLFGFYGGGEIGASRTGAVSEALGFSISVAALFSGPLESEHRPIRTSEHAFDGWRLGQGDWQLGLPERLSQVSLKPDCRALAGSSQWTDYELSLRARKRSGAEGFLIMFRVGSGQSFYWWNVAGWGNTAHAIETSIGGVRRVVARTPGRIEEGRWYPIRIRVEADRIRCFLDGELVHDFVDDATPLRSGGIGVGTWRTAADFEQIQVVDLNGGDVLLRTSSVERGSAAALRPVSIDTWERISGDWRVLPDGRIRQLSAAENCRILAPHRAPHDLVLELEARKTAGEEGFLVIFRAQNADDFYWWNVGGWRNTRHAVERKGGKGARQLGPLSGSVKTGQTYRLRVVLAGDRIRCWLDGRLLHDVRDELFRTGRIGLGTWRTKVEFTNVRLADLEDIPDDSASCLVDRDPFAETVAASRVALRRSQPIRAPAALLEEFRRRSPTAMARLLDCFGGHSEFAAWLVGDGPALAELGPAYRLWLSRPGAAASVSPSSDEPATDAEWLKVMVDGAASFSEHVRIRCGPIACVRRDGYGMTGTNGTMFARRTGVGSDVLVWSPARPESAPDVVFHTGTGFVWDLCPSYDGRRVLMSYKPFVHEPFHVWELVLDEGVIRQVTRGPYHDFNPVYLPDGRIAFSSSRVESYSVCQNFLACALFTCAQDGSDIRRIDFTTLCTNAPAVLQDGGLVATRWEYQDKNIFSWQGIWRILPNGRNLGLFYGNTVTVPNSLYGPRPIPGRPSHVVMTMAAHHYPPIGDIAIVDRHQGVENLEAVRQVTFATPYRVAQGKDYRDTNWQPGDRFYPQSYADPWPVSPDVILAAYGGGVVDPKPFGLLALSSHGARTTLLRDDAGGLFYPVSLLPRPLPDVIPGQCPTAAGVGVFYVRDIYRGLVSQGVTRGQVARLRVMQVLPKKYNTEGPRYHDHYPAIGHGSYYVKQIVGSVPVRDDGSVYFEAPSNCELYFIALDDSGREVQRMGSVTQLTTGEEATCVGCHESRLSAPPVQARVLHTRGEPDKLQAPKWTHGKVEPVSFVRHVQPILDAHCVRCHSGPAPRADLDLSGDKGRIFSMAYTNLTLRKLVDYYYINPGPTGVFPALKTGSLVSPLSRIIEKRHHGVVVPQADRRAIYAWIDANAPYYGTWEMSRPHSLGGRDTWTTSPGMTPRPWFRALLDAMATCGIRNAVLAAHNGSAHIDQLRINLTHPEWSLLLRENLASAAGGTASDGKAVFRSREDPGYTAVLGAIQEGKQELLAMPRMDMPGARPVPQKRDFGLVFGAPKPTAEKP